MIFINSDRLIIRSWKFEDYKDMYEINSDEKVNLNAGCHIVDDIEVIKSKMNSFISNNQSYAIVLKEEDKVIGTIGYDNVFLDEFDNELNQVYIGYRFNSNYWGKGYATEAAKSFISYLFEECNVDIIWTSHYDFNTRSKRVINKCGFQHKFNKSTTVKVLGNRIVTEVFYCIIKK
ncbi:GNAT family N-acetyltransferase [Clostridium tertium]